MFYPIRLSLNVFWMAMAFTGAFWRRLTGHFQPRAEAEEPPNVIIAKSLL